MENVIKLTDEQVAAILEEWFNNNQAKILIDKNFWARDVIGKLIKDRLNKIGKWKYRARGNPKKGYEASKSKQINW